MLAKLLCRLGLHHYELSTRGAVKRCVRGWHCNKEVWHKK